jgi:hypothetical protein
MSNRKMLEEAIADAKSVKETAIANAKAALEEAFTPYLKEKFTAKLAEMEAEDMEEAKEEMEETNGTEDMEEMSNPVMRHGLKGDDKEEIETEKMRDNNMDEMDLDELLAELEEEMSKESELNEAEESEAERADVDKYEYEKGEEAGEDEGDEEEDEEIDLEDMTEEELKDLIEDVIADMVTAGELEAGENFEEEGEDEDVEVDVDVDTEEETIDENARTLDEESEAERADVDKYEYEKGKKAGKNENVDMEEGIADKLKAVWNDPEMLGKIITVDGKKMSLKDFLGLAASGASSGMKQSGAGKGPFNTESVEMEEMRKEIEELASTLSEVKLFNAKLLYTNKIFRAKNLTESQKVKVLEAFDKANTVSDAKLIFETLIAVKETKSAVTESMRGMASKATGMAPEKRPILEVDNQFARWQILAGIKKQ